MPKDPSFTCLIVEDDAAFSEMLTEVVTSEGGLATSCDNIRAALDRMERSNFDLTLLDNHLPDGASYEFYERFTRANPDRPIVMITGVPQLNQAVELTRNGLFEYLTKPVEMNALVACIRRAKLRMRHDAKSDDFHFHGRSESIRKLRQEMEAAARYHSATALITGETGVGKDVVARTLHTMTAASRETPGDFVALNCAAVPADMIEAELFGSEKGAYTGAVSKRLGLVEAANNGSLFLDEIGEASLDLQAKLLRFLESGEYRPLGGVQTRAFSGRVITATNRSLPDEVARGAFREDLLYRINLFTLHIPPLRQRPEDIDGLAELLLEKIAAQYGGPKPNLNPEDLESLRNYAFPGNVRELRNIIERAYLKKTPNSHWLPLEIPKIPRPSPEPNDEPEIPRELAPIEAEEYRMIRSALQVSGGGIRRAASIVGLSPQSLLRRLQKWPELREVAKKS